MHKKLRMKFSFIAFAVTCLIGMSPAAAFEMVGSGGAKVVIEIPEGFSHVFSSTDPLELYEFVPSGEDVGNWSEMITVMRIPGTYLDANGALKDFGSIKLLAYVETCTNALMNPVVENGTINGQVSISTSFGCITKEAVRSMPNVDVRPFEFLSVTYVQGKEHVYEVQRAVHFDTLTAATLPDALAHNASNLEYSRRALSTCCGD